MCLLKLILKVSALLAMTSNGLLYAETLQTETSVDVQGCPENFYALPLYPNAKFCQLFAEQLPASLSYFAISFFEEPNLLTISFAGISCRQHCFGQYH